MRYDPITIVAFKIHGCVQSLSLNYIQAWYVTFDIHLVHDDSRLSLIWMEGLHSFMSVLIVIELY